MVDVGVEGDVQADAGSRRAIGGAASKLGYTRPAVSTLTAPLAANAADGTDRGKAAPSRVRSQPSRRAQAHGSLPAALGPDDVANIFARIDRLNVPPPMLTESPAQGAARHTSASRGSHDGSGGSPDRASSRAAQSRGRNALAPIEETLLTRRLLAKAASAPQIAASDALATFSSLKHFRSSGRPIELLRGSDGQSGGDASSRAASSSAAREASPSLRTTSLSPDLLPQLKQKGWAKMPAKGSIWGRATEDFVERFNAAFDRPSIARDRLRHERLLLLSALERENVVPGVEAVRISLQARCGSLEEAHAQLDVRQRGEKGITLLEFAGGAALLGLDVRLMSGGLSEQEVLKRLDHDGDGRLSLQDLRREAKSAAAQPAFAGDTNDFLNFWVLFAKFVALSAWFDTPAHLRRRVRYGPGDEYVSDFEDDPKAAEDAAVSAARNAESAAARAEQSLREATDVAESLATRMAERRGEPPSKEPPSPTVAESAELRSIPVLGGLSGGLAVSAHAAAMGGGTRTMRPNARDLQTDPIRMRWAPNEFDLYVARQGIEQRFMDHASIERNGVRLLTRPDFFRFLGFMPPPARCGPVYVHRKMTRINGPEAGRIFDEALAMQVGLTGLTGRLLSKGLTFQFLRVALMQVALSIGLHFCHMVDDAMDAAVQAVVEQLAEKQGPGSIPKTTSASCFLAAGHAPARAGLV
eukprot:TRINITY_DN8132_c0_g1_i1.p1 TRINITY_DN8132_c0_g1~~TRINITY_DN8132_c0_g1_i1.p1  ORF type:complete len:714 (+),score=134.05 TRINITY_DN8132_c0_g1_i1:47-2143(+)